MAAQCFRCHRHHGLGSIPRETILFEFLFAGGEQDMLFVWIESFGHWWRESNARLYIFSLFDAS